MLISDLNGNEIEATKYNGCYYHKIESMKDAYFLIYPVRKNPAKIRDGYKGYYYLIDGVLYGSIGTNKDGLAMESEYHAKYLKGKILRLNKWITYKKIKQYKQLSLFD